MDNLSVLGRAEVVAFPELGMSNIPARIDTGAKTSSIWVSSATEENGVLSVIFLGVKQPAYSGTIVEFKEYDTVRVASSSGHIQVRYRIRLLVSVGSKKIFARFTLADRSRQVYPVLIGRNVLTGKFIVNVKVGSPLLKQEQTRSVELQSARLANKKREATS